MARSEDERSDIASRMFQFLWLLCTLTFVAIKLAGTSLAAWSWWWILVPPVPLIGAAAAHFGL